MKSSATPRPQIQYRFRSFWERNPEAIGFMDDYLQSGMTYSQVSTKLSEQFSEQISKNACMGAASRNGLKQPNAKPKAPKPPKPQKGARFKAEPWMPSEMPVIEAATLPDGSHYTMATIPFSGRCKFPIGDSRDPDFHLCGQPCTGVYCAGHRAIAWQKDSANRGYKSSDIERMSGLARAFK